MTFVEVKELPKRKRNEYHNLHHTLDSFMKMNFKMAEVLFSSADWVTSNGAYSAFRQGIKIHGLPIDVRSINGRLFLIRRDL